MPLVCVEQQFKLMHDINYQLAASSMGNDQSHDCCCDIVVSGDTVSAGGARHRLLSTKGQIHRLQYAANYRIHEGMQGPHQAHGMYHISICDACFGERVMVLLIEQLHVLVQAMSYPLLLQSGTEGVQDSQCLFLQVMLRVMLMQAQCAMRLSAQVTHLLIVCRHVTAGKSCCHFNKNGCRYSKCCAWLLHPCIVSLMSTAEHIFACGVNLPVVDAAAGGGIVLGC